MVGKKIVKFDVLAQKEYHKDVRVDVKEDLLKNVLDLQETGRLEHPRGKKITSDLFEMRFPGTPYRAFYAYTESSSVIILSFFVKKRDKIPKRDIETAERRRQRHL